MKAFHDCLPCLLRQTLEAARLAGADPEAEEKIMRESMAILSNYKNYSCVPEMCKLMHVVAKTHTGVNDPYNATKMRDIEEAKKVFPFLKEFVSRQKDSLYWAVKVAAMGNVLDAGIYNFVDIQKVVEKELEKEFAINDVALFAEKLKSAKSLLIIADNAGETVFDRVLAEHLPDIAVTYAVRHSPIINDATVEDARLSGLDECTTIISNGCGAPGAILKECSAEFKEALASADIIISKGQGNYEALSDEGLDIFFLLKAKCNVIARRLGVSLNEYVFTYIGKN